MLLSSDAAAGVDALRALCKVFGEGTRSHRVGMLTIDLLLADGHLIPHSRIRVNHVLSGAHSGLQYAI
jgi:hypothetical protein